MSIFDLFNIGIGPSSSHTLGPMRAATAWLESLQKKNILNSVTGLKVELYGSLALTGIGHGTLGAIQIGLLGCQPDQIDSSEVAHKIGIIAKSGHIELLGKHSISFNITDISLNKTKRLPKHSNGMIFNAYDSSGNCINSSTYYSVGGGAIAYDGDEGPSSTQNHQQLLFSSGEELLNLCDQQNCSISELVERTELTFRNADTINSRISTIYKTMMNCIDSGLNTTGILPGGLHVQRRSPHIYSELSKKDIKSDPALVMDYVSCFAMAVNEENAAGGRVVTAPTNGAAGIIPAILRYHDTFLLPLNLEALKVFFFTAGAIGHLYKLNASLSGAEMGCQGEVGVASSMAAAGLAALKGASPIQIEAAAEIAMEHHLGLTCDPVKGLVQIPCIERNTMGAVKAMNAARLAMHGDGTHKVSLDKVIKTMKMTGEDMKSRYKETSKGGLAINVVEC